MSNLEDKSNKSLADFLKNSNTTHNRTDDWLGFRDDFIPSTITTHFIYKNGYKNGAKDFIDIALHIIEFTYSKDLKGDIKRALLELIKDGI